MIWRTILLHIDVDEVEEPRSYKICGAQTEQIYGVIEHHHPMTFALYYFILPFFLAAEFLHTW